MSELPETDVVVYRDAKTGEYVTAEYAKANPDTTVSETETGSDEMLEQGGVMEQVQAAQDKFEHDEANEEALVAATEPEDDGLPDAE